MMYNYSQNAQILYSNICKINDMLQSQLTSTQNSADIRRYITTTIESTSDTFLSYFNEYYNMCDNNMSDECCYLIPLGGEDTIYSYLNLDDEWFNCREYSDNAVDGIILKYLNLEYIFDNLSIKPVSDEYNDFIYTTDNLITTLDFIKSEFIECISNIKSICNNENHIFNMCHCYIYELKVIMYIIEFIEAIHCNYTGNI